MVEDSRKVKIKNRVGNGTVGYTIPDMNNLTRIFEDGEEKDRFTGSADLEVYLDFLEKNIK